MRRAVALALLLMGASGNAASLYKSGDVPARYIGRAPTATVLTLEDGRWAVISADEYSPGLPHLTVLGVKVTYLAVDAALCDDMNCDVLGSVTVSLPEGKLRGDVARSGKPAYYRQDGRVTVHLETMKSPLTRAARAQYPRKQVLMNYLLRLDLGRGKSYTTLLR